jgi:phosphoglycolate phosphatase-like HAD superfamily hydrolase
LRELHGRLPLYVASGTPHEELLRIVERRGLAHFFEGVNGSPWKKSDVIREVARNHGCSTGEVLMVGDGETDLRAAQVAGAAFYGRRTPAASNVFDAEGCDGAEDLTTFCAYVDRR